MCFKVAVTGAGGRTGSLVLKKLLANPAAYEPVATVRSASSAAKLEKTGLSKAAIFEVDIAQGGSEAMAAALKGCEAMVIATSAVPKIK